MIVARINNRKEIRSIKESLQIMHISPHHKKGEYLKNLIKTTSFSRKKISSSEYTMNRLFK